MKTYESKLKSIEWVWPTYCVAFLHASCIIFNLFVRYTWFLYRFEYIWYDLHPFCIIFNTVYKTSCLRYQCDYFQYDIHALRIMRNTFLSDLYASGTDSLVLAINTFDRIYERKDIQTMPEQVWISVLVWALSRRSTHLVYFWVYFWYTFGILFVDIALSTDQQNG